MMLRDVTRRRAPGPGKPTGLVTTLDRLAETMADGMTWMTSEECADFISMNYDEFGKVAKMIPRHPLPPKRPGTTSRRYRYYAPRSPSGSSPASDPSFLESLAKPARERMVTTLT